MLAHPADAVARRAGRGGAGRDRLAGRRAAAAAQPGRARRAGVGAGARGRLGALEGRLHRGRASRWREKEAWPASSGCCSC